MYLLQLRDGDLLLVRNAEHAPPAAAAAAAAGAAVPAGTRGRGARGAARGGGGGVSCAFVGKPRREEGIKIHTVFDQLPVAAAEAEPAAEEVGVGDVLTACGGREAGNARLGID